MTTTLSTSVMPTFRNRRWRFVPRHITFYRRIWGKKSKTKRIPIDGPLNVAVIGDRDSKSAQMLCKYFEATLEDLLQSAVNHINDPSVSQMFCRDFVVKKKAVSVCVLVIASVRLTLTVYVYYRRFRLLSTIFLLTQNSSKSGL